MMIARFSAPALLAATILVAGCKKTEKAPVAEPAGSAAPAPKEASMTKETPAPPAAPAPAADPNAAAAPAAGGDAVVPSPKLEAINLPPFKGAPAKGMWSSAEAGGDGDRAVNFQDGDAYWVSLRFLDCNLPKVKAVASKPPASTGDFGYCHMKPTGKLGEYDMVAPNDTTRAVRVGHVMIITGVGVAGEGKIKGADLEDYIKSLDLAAIAKL